MRNKLTVLLSVIFINGCTVNIPNPSISQVSSVDNHSYTNIDDHSYRQTNNHSYTEQKVEPVKLDNIKVIEPAKEEIKTISIDGIWSGLSYSNYGLGSKIELDIKLVGTSVSGKWKTFNGNLYNELIITGSLIGDNLTISTNDSFIKASGKVSDNTIDFKWTSEGISNPYLKITSTAKLEKNVSVQNTALKVLPYNIRNNVVRRTGRTF